MPRFHVGSAQVLAAFCLLLPVTSLVAPKAVVPLLILGFLALGATLWREQRRLVWPDRWTCLCFALVIGWCVVSSAWSLAPVEAALRALRMGGLMLIGLLFARWAYEASPAAAQKALWWLWLGLILALALTVEELLLGNPIFILLKGEAPDSYLELSRLNRGASAFAMLCWLAAAGSIFQGRKAVALATLIATGAILPFLESSAATLAFVLAAAILLLSFLSGAAGRILLIISIVGLLFASPGIAKLLNEAGLAEQRGLQVTARERVYIWNFTADRIFEKPLFGWGYNASRHIPNGEVPPFDPRLGKHKKKLSAAALPHRKIIPHHPHNAGLQILLELGIVGALLIAALLWVYLRRLEGLPRRCLPWARASALATVAVAGTAYGIWQNQWQATMAANAAVIALLGAASRPAAEHRPPDSAS